jgi:hypothetical protein
MVHPGTVNLLPGTKTAPAGTPAKDKVFSDDAPVVKEPLLVMPAIFLLAGSQNPDGL